MFRRHVPELWAIASLVAEDTGRAEEAMARAVRFVAEHPAKVRIGHRGERAALAAVVYRCCDELARASTGPDRGDSGAALASLTRDQRSALALARFGDHTYRDIARLLNVEPPVVAAQLRSALHRLSGHIDLTNHDSPRSTDDAVEDCEMPRWPPVAGRRSSPRSERTPVSEVEVEQPVTEQVRKEQIDIHESTKR